MPPKRLARTPDGLLRLKTFEGFDAFLGEELDTCCVQPLKPKGRGCEGRLDQRRWKISNLHGFILLSLADQRFTCGHAGVYLETVCLSVDDLALHRLRTPDQTDDHLIGG